MQAHGKNHLTLSVNWPVIKKTYQMDDKKKDGMCTYFMAHPIGTWRIHLGSMELIWIDEDRVCPAIQQTSVCDLLKWESRLRFLISRLSNQTYSIVRVGVARHHNMR